MPNLLVWFVGNRNPSISEIITTSDGTVKNLTGLAVKFKCRAVGSSTLLVDAAVSNTLDATGFVRYDWTAADIATGALSAERDLLIWWEVTETSKTQDMNEALIQVFAHAPQTNTYLELEELKATLELTGTDTANYDLKAAIVSASRIVDDLTGRRFYADSDANQVRYFTPYRPDKLIVDDIITLTELATDSTGGTTFGTVWTVNTDFVMYPLNAAAESRPWEEVLVHPSGSNALPVGYQRSVRVTGKFGWSAVPENVRVATGIIATKIVKRAKDAPMGVISFFDGSAVRMSQFDPQVDELLSDFKRPVVVG